MSKSHFFSKKTVFKNLGVAFLAATMGAGGAGLLGGHDQDHGGGEHQPHTRREEEFVEQREDLEAVNLTKRGRLVMGINGPELHVYPVAVAKA